MQYFITKYYTDHNILVSEVKFDDREKLTLKVLAGDDDIDLYVIPAFLNVADFVRNKAYDDLSQYSELRDVINQNEEMMKYTASVGSEIFGVPINLYFVNTKDLHINEEAYIKTNNKYQYIFENIDIYDRKFEDKDGKALTQMLNYISDRDISQSDYAVSVNGDYTYVSSDYVILNKASVHKTEAVDFLKFVMTELSAGTDSYTGSEYIQMVYYPKDVSYESAYIWWRHVNTDIMVTLSELIDNTVESGVIPDNIKDTTEKIMMMITE